MEQLAALAGLILIATLVLVLIATTVVLLSILALIDPKE